MNVAMVTATIGAISTIIVAIISGLVALKVSNKQHDKTIALIEYRLGELEAKMDKHNNAVERLTVLETKFKLLEGRNDG